MWYVSLYPESVNVATVTLKVFRIGPAAKRGNCYIYDVIWVSTPSVTSSDSAQTEEALHGVCNFQCDQPCPQKQYVKIHKI